MLHERFLLGDAKRRMRDRRHRRDIEIAERGSNAACFKCRDHIAAIAERKQLRARRHGGDRGGIDLLIDKPERRCVRGAQMAEQELRGGVHGLSNSDRAKRKALIVTAPLSAPNPFVKTAGELRGQRFNGILAEHFRLRDQFSCKCAVMDKDLWELASYVVTVIGLPLAIFVFIFEQRKERDNEEENVYQLLSDNYQDFLKIALDNSDLHLFSAEETPELSNQQKERMLIIFSMLISLFERAYLLLFEDDMSDKQKRRWSSWEDYMVEWLNRRDFRTLLPTLLRGEDPRFAAYIQRLASETAA